MPSLGSKVAIRLQLGDRVTNQFPRAVVKTPAGVPIAGSPFDLVHSVAGLYLPASFPSMPTEDFLIAQYLVYSDSGHTTLNPDYLSVEEHFPLTPEGGGSGTGAAADITLEIEEVDEILLEMECVC